MSNQPKSLKDSTPQPSYTKAVIKSAMRSPIGIERVWCVVESSDDVDIYQKFLDTSVSILPSEDENHKCSCHNVEDIVTSLYAENGDIRLFGIRDCDYTRYDSSYCCPQNVFLTDCRDVEMMMFCAPSVTTDLEKWDSSFPEKIEECANVVCHIGHLRIYNELKQTSCIFRNFLKSSLVWDLANHCVIPEFKQNLFDKFKAACAGNTVDKADFETFIDEHKLGDEPYEYVCRGHDMQKLLPLMMIKTSVFSKENITRRMVNAYSVADFAKTQLYNNIQDWAKSRSLTVLL